jgi:hypothetical protein
MNSLRVVQFSIFHEPALSIMYHDLDVFNVLALKFYLISVIPIDCETIRGVNNTSALP